MAYLHSLDAVTLQSYHLLLANMTRLCVCFCSIQDAADADNRVLTIAANFIFGLIANTPTVAEHLLAQIIADVRSVHISIYVGL